MKPTPARPLRLLDLSHLIRGYNQGFSARLQLFFLKQSDCPGRLGKVSISSNSDNVQAQLCPLSISQCTPHHSVWSDSGLPYFDYYLITDPGHGCGCFCASLLFYILLLIIIIIAPHLDDLPPANNNRHFVLQTLLPQSKLPNEFVPWLGLGFKSLVQRQMNGEQKGQRPESVSTLNQYHFGHLANYTVDGSFQIQPCGWSFL